MSRQYKLLKVQEYKTHPYNSTLGSAKYHLEEGDFDLNPFYQRDYVWGKEEQDTFLRNVINEYPIGTIVIVIDENKNEGFMEVVDGKQRLTTLKLFFENKISIDGLYWKDLDIVEQRVFRGLKFPMEVLRMRDGSDVSDKVKLDLFFNVNFTGMPQSDDHKKRILELMGN